MIKVLILRRAKRSNYIKLMGCLRDLRANALRHPGYVTGETLIKTNGSVDVMVISTWISESHWKAWSTSQTRIELEDLVDHLLEESPKTEVFQVPAEWEE